MSQLGLSDLIVDSPTVPAPVAAGPAAPQRFYPMPPQAAIFITPPKTEKSGSPLLIALIIVLVLVIAYVAMRYWKKKKLVDHLASKGWVLYTMPGCGYCTKQLAVLGARYPKQVECSSKNAACDKIKAFPFWKNEKTYKTRTGYQSQEQLESMLRD